MLGFTRIYLEIKASNSTLPQTDEQTDLGLINVVFDEVLILFFVYKHTEAGCEIDISKFAILPFQFEIHINGEVKNIQVSERANQ